ncbi:hypothetical protein CC86DRAFT_403959 [Ophiobolus disseminans]|uniref:Uncharacterized protein n=1 Tax=Ophiobolus disseminans TaxID=1469910 RepID=A0A6A7A9D8_9PLEO|nr:hypothetical protein CC86DRAFT_403959 [Ophiobolus disseminans]
MPPTTTARTMPYIIHIPRHYQSRTHLMPALYTTTATSVAVSTSSALARAIYADALEWGWNVERPDVDAWETENGMWEKYCEGAKRRRWFDDIFRIWQREHGHRILQKDTLSRRSSTPPTSPNSTSPITSSLRRFKSWLATHKGHQSDLRLKNRKVVYTPPRKLPAGTEPQKHVAGSATPDSIMSLSASLVGRLEGRGRERNGDQHEEEKKRELGMLYGKLIDVDNEEDEIDMELLRVLHHEKMRAEEIRAEKMRAEESRGESSNIPYFYAGAKWGPNDG